MNSNVPTPASNSNAAQNSPSIFQHPGTAAANPLDFISKNLRNPQAQNGEVQVQSASSPDPKIVAPEVKVEHPLTAKEEVTIPTEPELEFDPIGEKSEEVKESAPAEEELPDLGADDKVSEQAVINWKKIRENFKAEKQEHLKTKEALAAAAKELEAYKKGEKIPDALQVQEDELARLRRYEKAFNLKGTKEYQEKLETPWKNVQQKLKEGFKEYQVPEEYLGQLRGMKVSEQNEFLSDHFDQVGALQIRNLLDQEKDLYGKIKQAEAEPEAELNRLMQESSQARAIQQKQEKALTQERFRDSWVKAANAIKEEGVFVELIHKATDSEYNKNVVDPIYRKAGTEAGKLLAKLIECGFNGKDQDVLDYICRMSLLAHSSAINATTRERAMNYAKELSKNMERSNSAARPMLGGSGGAGNAPAAPREPMTPDNLGKAILSRTMQK